MRSKAGQGAFYFGNSQNNFRTMVAHMKDYLRNRSRWIDRSLLQDYRPPPTPTIDDNEPIDQTQEALQFRIASDSNRAQSERYAWRLAAVTKSPSSTFKDRQPLSHEIDAV